MSEAAKAFISFLRCEAKQAEERARSLRATAAIIESNSLEAQRRECKKRKRTRKADSDQCDESKTCVSGFSLFIQENQDSLQQNESTGVARKEIGEVLEDQWNDLGGEEKQSWQSRAADLILHQNDHISARTEDRNKTSAKP